MKKLYILFLLCSLLGFSQNPGDLVITEIMNNPDPLTDTTGEWFEIYNTTGSDIDILGWTLKDDGTDTHVIIAGGESGNGTTIVPAGGYFVLGRSDNGLDNGGASVNYSYGTGGHTLGNGADEIVLLTPGAVEIARVNYDGGPVFPDLTGASMQLDPGSINGTDSNIGTNWCASTAAYGDGSGSLGTPGAANSACAPVCEASLGSSDTVCDTVTVGATSDTYTATLDYSGAATGEIFTVTTSPTGFTITGDNPTTTASGTIIVSGITEGTDITITVDNTGDSGLCNLTRDITSPVCEPTGSVDLELRGVMDFTVPSGGSDGKAIHLVATADIVDLSEYRLGSANNGGGTDGEEYTLPAISVSSGDNILIVRSLTAIEAYFTTAGFNLFEVVIENVGGAAVDGNGNDAVELFKLGSVVETFGDINDAVADTWNYLDSWAYKDVLGSDWPADWSYGGVNCTDVGNTTFESSCVYPFLSALSISDFDSEELSIYPNPVSSGVVHINSQTQGDKIIDLYDILGRNVLSKTLNSDVLDVSSIKSGIYLLKISANGRTTVTKLIIK